MKKISKEVKIGIAFIIAIFVLYYGISFLKGINKFKQADSYLVVFNDVEGLTKASPITVNGFQVGLVFSMGLDPNNKDRIVVNLSMDKGVNIPKDSKLEIAASMLGSANIELHLGDSNDLYTVTDTILGTRKKGLSDIAGELAPKAEDLLPKIDSILSNIEKLVSNPALQHTLGNVDEITKNIALTTKQLNTISGTVAKDLPAITNNLNTISNDLVSVTGKVKNMDVASTFKSLDATVKNIEHISGKAASKDNSLGLLLNDRQLYDSINVTISNMSLLLKDVKENPGKYINVKVF